MIRPSRSLAPRVVNFEPTVRSFPLVACMGRGKQRNSFVLLNIIFYSRRQAQFVCWFLVRTVHVPVPRSGRVVARLTTRQRICHTFGSAVPVTLIFFSSVVYRGSQPLQGFRP
jgi:hypothetical protein